jgi:hypothetical protein
MPSRFPPAVFYTPKELVAGHDLWLSHLDPNKRQEVVQANRHWGHALSGGYDA